MKLGNFQELKIHSMGKIIAVTAIFHSDDDANRYLVLHRDEGVIAEFKPYIFIANLYDN